MENTKKAKIFVTIFIMLPFIGCITLGILYSNADFDKDVMQTIINQQDLLLKDIKKRDSIFTLKNKHYADIIEKYNGKVIGCSITIGKKNYSFDQFVDLYDKLELENYKLKDSINAYKEGEEKIMKMSREVIKKDKMFKDSLKKLTVNPQ